MAIIISEKDFGTLCICAIRYCHGRKTYMPKLVQDIVKEYLDEFDDKDIKVMENDCQFQRDFDVYGDGIDKENWLEWEKLIKEERKKRLNKEYGN